MKITASKRDEILKRKAEYDAKLAKYEARNKETTRAYNEAQDAVLSKVQSAVEELLAGLDSLSIEVTSSNYYFGGRGAHVKVNCTAGALRWTYEASLDDNGQISTDTTSWSGLSATTQAEVDSLKQTAEALDRLVNADWATILDVKTPNYKDYMDLTNIPPDPEDFNKQLEEVTLEELIGQNKIIKVFNWEGSGYNGRYVWVKLTGQTPSFWKVNVFSDHVVINDFYGESPAKYNYSERYGDVRVSKSKLRIPQPEEIKEI